MAASSPGQSLSGEYLELGLGIVVCFSLSDPCFSHQHWIEMEPSGLLCLPLLVWNLRPMDELGLLSQYSQSHTYINVKFLSTRGGWVEEGNPQTFGGTYQEHSYAASSLGCNEKYGCSVSLQKTVQPLMGSLSKTDPCVLCLDCSFCHIGQRSREKGMGCVSNGTDYCCA